MYILFGMKERTREEIEKNEVLNYLSLLIGWIKKWKEKNDVIFQNTGS